MFSCNAMEIFILSIQKLSARLLLPWKQNQPFTNNYSFINVTIATLLLELIDLLLTHLLNTSFCFKDGRLIQELFTLHKILCSKPPAGQVTSMLTKIQEDIIGLLIKFMKFTSKAPESEEGKIFSNAPSFFCTKLATTMIKGYYSFKKSLDKFLLFSLVINSAINEENKLIYFNLYWL